MKLRKNTGFVVFRLILTGIFVSLIWICSGEVFARWVVLAVILLELYYISSKLDDKG